MDAWREYRYPVMERFLTVQGEGAFTGASAWFIRLGGCDVGCAWCDVKESWDAAAHPQMSAHALVEEAAASGAPLCVVTGGEPAMHDLTALTEGLQAAGMRTHIETSGTHPLTGSWNWVTFSPKRFKAPLEEIYAKADELKIIVVNRHDLAWGEEHAGQVANHTMLYLQPEWDRRTVVLPYIMDHLKVRPNWRISLQTHKYVGLP